jgi:hypothetical protein
MQSTESAVRVMRQQLDTAVSNATGADYQAYKNQYGTFKELGEQTNRMFNRKSGSLGGSMAHVFALDDMAKGVLQLDPHGIAAGAALESVKQFTKWLDSPDRSISGLFKTLDKYGEGAAGQNIKMPYSEPIKMPGGEPAPKPSTQLALPAPKEGAVKAQVNAPIEMPSRSQSTIDNAERAKLSSPSAPNKEEKPTITLEKGGNKTSDAKLK